MPKPPESRDNLDRIGDQSNYVLDDMGHRTPPLPPKPLEVRRGGRFYWLFWDVADWFAKDRVLPAEVAVTYVEPVEPLKPRE